MPDVKVNLNDRASGHLDYPVPATAEFLLKQAFARYDGSGAGGAWLPALQLIGPDGQVAGSYVTGSTVAAGASADVTFGPFLRGASGGGGGITDVSAPFVAAMVTAQVIPSGAATALVFNSYTAAQGAQPMIDLSGFPVTFSTPTIVAVAPFTATLTVVWPAANYDRYSEIVPSGFWTDGATRFTTRVRHATTPDGDVQSQARVVDFFAPGDTLGMNVFQSSGINRTVVALLELRGITSLIPPSFG